jgi:hypothetical protein
MHISSFKVQRTGLKSPGWKHQDPFDIGPSEEGAVTTPKMQGWDGMKNKLRNTENSG